MEKLEKDVFRDEPRFYPAYQLDVDVDRWRALPKNERMRRSFAYSHAIKQALFTRLCGNHPSWNAFQHRLLFFKLRYAGEHFETFAQGQLKHGYLTCDEIQCVRNVPIPTSSDGCNLYFLSESELEKIALDYVA